VGTGGTTGNGSVGASAGASGGKAKGQGTPGFGLPLFVAASIAGIVYLRRRMD
jgi:hypothetical protein